MTPSVCKTQPKLIIVILVMDPDRNVDHPQNLMGSSSARYTCLVKASYKSVRSRSDVDCNPDPDRNPKHPQNLID